MAKETFRAIAPDAGRAAEFVRRTLEEARLSEAMQNLLARVTGEVMQAICEHDPDGGQVLLSASVDAVAAEVQFMHAGPMFKPYSRQAEQADGIDEVSFEFKYGRNVLTIYKKKFDSEVKTMKELLRIGTHSLNTDSHIAILCARERGALLEQAAALGADKSVALVEWRIDAFEDVFEIKQMPEAVRAVRKALGDKPLLYTFRNGRFGGAHPSSCMYLTRLNAIAEKEQAADLINVELFENEDASIANLTDIRACGAKSVLTHIDIDGMPLKKGVDLMLARLYSFGPDVVEYGARCINEKDYETIRQAFVEFKQAHPDQPLIMTRIAADGSEVKTLY